MITTNKNNIIHAEDKLYLCGILKNIANENEIVEFDIKSRNCNGIRNFRIYSTVDMSLLKINERLCFFLESNKCDNGHIYNIIKIEKE